MRISDWSSDVCSSDLACRYRIAGHGIDVAESVCLACGDHQHPGRIGHLERFDPIVCAVNLHSAWHSLLGQRHKRGAIQLLDGISAGLKRKAGIWMRDDIAPAVNQVRSEEHTSELP